MEKVWKNQKGITLVSLMVYLIGLIAIIGIVAVLTSFYSKNVATMNDTSEVNSEFNKFDAKMIQETKTAGNKIEEVSGTTIRFKNGNTYTYGDNRIYQNAVTVSKYVKDFAVNFSQDGDKQILSVYVTFGKGKIEVAKSVSYVVEVDGSEFVGGLSNVGAVSSPGITASEVADNSTKYFGKYVNYKVPEGGDINTKWQIFYADNENIYLISNDIINGPSEFRGLDLGSIVNMTEQRYTNIQDIEEFEEYKNGKIAKWFDGVKKNKNNITGNYGRNVLALLDSRIWNKIYKNEYADYTIGGPTVEILCKSYNKNKENKINYTIEADRYIVGDGPRNKC